MEEESGKSHVSVHWFRHGLRLHDNPALLASLKDCSTFYPVFVLDDNVAGIGTAAYPRMRFLFETLQDLDNKFKAHGSRLHILKGTSVDVFEKLFTEWGVTRLTFEADPEPIWQDRDNSVRKLCEKQDVLVVERFSHMLWQPSLILEENGGEPPLTYAMFNQVSDLVGPPPKPVADPDFSGVDLPVREDHDEKYGLPCLENIGVYPECEEQASPQGRYLGGETKALKLLASRLQKEEEAFRLGRSQPNQLNPDLTSMPMSLSPHLRFGSLSVRKFYWALKDLYSKMFPNCSTPPAAITSQLLWREYFYCMSVNNPNYDRMKGNPICLDIDWYDDEENFQKWKKGQTGYPWIDACMRQLLQEGWIHHVCRYATACFLTRGDLWIDWQKGLKVFDHYLLDADWSVCAGNWMWVSSSAFEKVLQCPRCICPVRYGRRIDPTGEYVRKYVPALKHMPLRYLFEPWNAPSKVQEEAGCIIGQDYPQPMVDHRKASLECMSKMEVVKKVFKDVPHIAPTNEEEVLQFLMCGKVCDKELLEGCTHDMDSISI